MSLMQRPGQPPSARPRVDALRSRAEPLVLERRASEVERGRRHVTVACAGLDETLVMTAALLSSELITNALRHGAGSITVLVTRTRKAVRVDVSDQSPVDPRPRRAHIDDENGRGLLIVETLADEWGMEPLPQGTGKSVWFVLAI